MITNKSCRTELKLMEILEWIAFEWEGGTGGDSHINVAQMIGGNFLVGVA